MAKRRRSAPNKARRATKQNKNVRILVVEARYYAHNADELLKGATAVLTEAGAEYDVVTVPGALEIAPAIAMSAEAGNYDGAVALGCVIQGETFHFDIVAMQSARALIDLSVAARLPIGNGILTVDNEAQAWARARITEQDKGGEAARATLALIALKRQRSKR